MLSREMSELGTGHGQHPPTQTQEKVGVTNDCTAPAVGRGTEDGINVESLMQERDVNTTVTVDEVADNSTPNYPTNIHIHMQGPHLIPANLIPGHPTQITNQPMTSPLQLVYLQPTPHGVHIIPFQAAGHPSFSPCSPLGFPAHPHHPVVVQQGHPFPLHHPTFYPSQPVYSPGPYPAYPPHTTPSYPTYYQVPVHFPTVTTPFPQNACTMATTEHYRQQVKFFRPWEDGGSLSSGNTDLCPHTDCGGDGGQHSQSVSSEEQSTSRHDLPPYSEEDFPALNAELSKLKIKK